MHRVLILLCLMATNIFGDTSTCTSVIEFNAGAGVFSDKSKDDTHSPNIKCYRIQPTTPHDSIELDITSFSTGPNDYLKVYDGNDTSGQLLHFLSGTFGYVSPVYSSTGSLFLQFTTLSQTASWSASYSAYSFCQDRVVVTNATGVINDGSRGRNYQNNAECSWLIAPLQPGSDFPMIELNFTSFDTADAGDVVSVYDGPNRLSPLLGQYHGKLGDKVPAIYTTGRNAFITFTSDSGLSAQGWEIQYKAIYCRQNAIVDDQSGVITDGSGMMPYNPNTHCSWVLNPTGKYPFMKLDFSTLHIRTGRILVFNGDQTQNDMIAALPIGTSSYPSVYTLRKKPVIIKFDTTADTTADDGFVIKYTGQFCRDTVTVTPQEGFIGDGSDSSDYEAGSDCSWIIPVSDDFEIVKLDFVYFSSDPQDTLIISQGRDSASAEVLIELSGSPADRNMVQQAIRTSPGMSVFFHWTTKSTGKGWLFQYQVKNLRKNPIDPLPPVVPPGTGPTIIHPVNVDSSKPETFSAGGLVAVIVVCTLAGIALIVFFVLLYRYRKYGQMSSLFSAKIPIKVQDVPSSVPSQEAIERPQNPDTNPGLTIGVGN